jgi:hypothetical protein
LSETRSTAATQKGCVFRVLISTLSLSHSLWCLKLGDFAGCHIRGVHSFYFEAISPRRRLLIPRSGQIGNCCRSRGMKESQINGPGVPVREIKLILAHAARLFSMRRSEFASVVGRSPSDKGLVHFAPDAAGQIAKSKSTSLRLYQLSSAGPRPPRVAAEKERRPSQVSPSSEHQQVFPCASPRPMADGDLTPHQQHSLARVSQNKISRACARMSKVFVPG